MASDFAVLILTHGRPDSVITFTNLRRHGYTGPIYVVVDNEDDTIEAYRERFGEAVIQFDKKAIAATFDQGDNLEDRRTVVFARNAAFGIAEQLGLAYFLELDDDYTGFWYKFDSNLVYAADKHVKDLDRLFATYLDFYKSVPALTLAMDQNGDFVGGRWGAFGAKLWLKRKAMNTFFCSTKRPFTFVGRVNEDVSTYVSEGNRGQLFLTAPNAAITQVSTQKGKGGMSDVYLSEGTYLKTFYTVMYAPSCVKVSEMGPKHKRIHHRINWRTAVPKIVSEELRKGKRDSLGDR